MKLHIRHIFCPKFLALLFILAAWTGIISAAITPTYNYSFAENSRLREGRWVKIHIDRTGLYEIPFSRLREMGFENPEKVGVYGNGGIVNSLTFIDNAGRRIFEDNLRAVAVYHGEDALYFYGRGVENITFDGSDFNRNDLNIYSYTGTYLLSDSQDPLLMEETTPGVPENVSVREDGIDYIYHESDLHHNYSGTGMLYWGESFLDNPVQSYPMTFRYARRFQNEETREVTKVRLELGLCLSARASGSMKLNFCNMNETLDLYRETGKRYLFNYKNFRMPSSKSSTLKMTFNDAGYTYMALDYWLATYNKMLPDVADDDFVQERIVLPRLDRSPGTMALTVPEGSLVLDISTPSIPVLMHPEGSLLGIGSNTLSRQYLVFDPSKSQLSIRPEYQVVENQNLHAEARSGIDLLILTVPAMREYAERIAELHRHHDGMKVLVAEPEQVYNEFTAGMPDPMAYRALAKMLFQSDVRPLRNVFFIGPIHGDYRGVEMTGERPYGFVSMQEPGDLCESDLSNVMDYAGYACDNISSGSSLSFLPLDMGVGILPINTPAQGEIAVKKISEYLEQLYDPSLAGIVNETITVSCPGDAMTHDIQACDIAGLFADYSRECTDGLIPHTNLRLEEYSTREGKREYINKMESGKLLTVYFGHSGPSQMAVDFMQSQDFVNMRNRRLGFLFTAGCELAVPDHGVTGIGEVCVTDAPRGMVGSITTCRTVWSNHNFDFAQRFITAIFYDDDVPRREAPTMGEVYAKAKSLLDNPNELCFYYVGDPALTFPLALRPGEVRAEAGDFSGGDMLKLEGRAMTTDRSAVDRGFNGEAVVKICAPRRSQVLQIRPQYDMLGNFIANDTVCSVHQDELLASASARIVDGEFKALNITLPAEADNYRKVSRSVKLPVYMSAYDATRRRSVAGYTEISLAPRVSAPDADTEPSRRDTLNPELRLLYDPASRVVEIVASDNSGVAPGIGAGRGVILQIDGEEVVRAPGISYGVTSVDEFMDFVPVAHLPEGEHTVRGRAVDTSGNISEEVQLAFRLNPAPRMRLIPEHLLVTDFIRFDVEGGAPGDLRLRIIDLEGDEVYYGPANSTEAMWDCTYMPSGTYRAAIVDNSSAGSMLCSDWVSFVVTE